ncbi:transposase [Labrys neptuniae]|uniref:Transposase n=1 Tax=Labrys neptuniae TaxID=376174 RepID=A0ABV3PVW9_9HYPH|nr:transposase [Labrys neptuniae]MDT3375705.1 transposase [Labrys neptuniae]
MADKKRPLQPEAEWHSRGYLPHWEAGENPQSITFRLADSLPVELLQRWTQESESSERSPNSTDRRRRYEEALDKGHGEALLVHPDAGATVQSALLHFDGVRYRLHAWSVMPNHVHVLSTPIDGHALSAIVHSWKSFTALQINRALGRQGTLWFPEYFDRRIRDEKHFETVRYYIEQNAVAAGLCARAQDWAFSSAAHTRLR